ncbi:tetratricopeptide repeat protein [bacterium]|nr:tetratricopeptide repeat protein [bacterium]
MAGNRRTRGVKQPNRPFVVRCGYALLCSVSLLWLLPAADLFAADTSAVSADSQPIPDKDLFEPIDPVKLDDKNEVVSPMLGGKEQPLKADSASIPGFKPPPASGKEKAAAETGKAQAANKAKNAAAPAMPVELQPIPADIKEAEAPAAAKDLAKPPSSLNLTPPTLPPTQLPPPPAVAEAPAVKPAEKKVDPAAAKAPVAPVALPPIPATAAKAAIPTAPVLPPVASEAAVPVKPMAAPPPAKAPAVAPPAAVEAAIAAPPAAKVEKIPVEPAPAKVAVPAPAPAVPPVAAAAAPATPTAAPPVLPPPVLPKVSDKTAGDVPLLPPVTITMPQAPEVTTRVKETASGGPVELPAEIKKAAMETSPVGGDVSGTVSEPKPVRMVKIPLPTAKPEAPEPPVVASLASRPNHASWYSSREPMPLMPSSRIPSNVDEVVRRLPSGLSSRSMPERPEPPVTIERVTDESDFPEEGYADDKPVGASARRGQRKSTVEEELNQAYEALMMGQTESAVSMYRQVLMEDPRNKLGMFGLATSLHRNGQYAQAQRAYAELLSYYPNYTDGLNNFFALMSDIAPGDAIRQLDELARRNPDFSPIPAQMGMVYMKNGEYENAASSLARAVTLSPENVTYRYNLAIALDKMGQNTEAVRLYQQVLEAMQNQKDSSIQLDAKNIQERLIFLRSKGT